MGMSLGKVNFEIPFVTLITSLLFVSAYAFKYGESVFFGYPINYFSLDITEVINLSLKMLSLFMVIFAVVTIPASIKDNLVDLTALVSSVIVSCSAIYFGYIRVRGGVWDWVSLLDFNVLLISAIAFVCLFKNFLNLYSRENKIDLRALIAAFLSMILFSFLLGVNYQSLPFVKVWMTQDDSYVVAQFKDGFLLKKCINDNERFEVIDIKGTVFYQIPSGEFRGLLIRCKV